MARISVLYVDDDERQLDSCRFYFERSGGIRVDTTVSVKEAIDKLTEQQYDAIISEYQMPGMSGIDLLKKVRSSGNTIPFILFTQCGREEIVVEAINNGADFLQKGGNPEAQFAELTHKVRVAVEHQRAVERILSLNRLYSVLYESNKAVVYLRTKTEFFSEICRILVETGGFRMAWIGLADAEHRIIRPVASAGHIDGYLDNSDISTEDVPRGRGPTGVAYREGKYFFSNDIAHDPRMEPWRENALKRGYKASAAFPFALGTKNAGIITVYAPVPGFFDERTITLLEELSRAIAFALATLDNEELRKSAENDLKKSELRYRRLFQTAYDGIVILDGDTGEIIDVNASILDMLGYPLEYFVGRHLWDLDVFQDKSLVRKVFAKRKNEGYIRYEDLLLKTQQGTDINVEFVSNVYVMDGRKIIHCNLRDITVRRQMEEKLHSTLERFYQILSEMPYGVMLVTDEDKVEFVNHEFCNIFGFEESPADLLNLPASEILEKIGCSPRYHDATMARIREIIRQRQPVKGEDVSIGNGKYLRYFIPLRLAGKHYGRLWIHIDVTERRKAEEALHESEEKYRNLFMNMTEEVHFWQLVRDPQGRITTWRLVDVNPPALRTWGRNREEILGKTADEIFGPGATDHYLPVVQKIMTESVPYSYDDFFLPLDKYFRFTSVPLGDYFITTGADITAIKKAENELIQKNVALNALNEELIATQEELHENIDALSRHEKDLTVALTEKEVLLSEIHHRVKNNLTAFISLLSLEGSTEDTPAGRMLKHDLQNRARSMALIHETLYRTRMYDEVDMGLYLKTLLDQIANTFMTKRSVKVVVNADKILLDIPRATPAGIIINELVTNSFKYAFPESFDTQAIRNAPPTITVTLSKNMMMYEMTVRDNGVGLPPGLDLTKTQSLGLKLVNFLAKHQMRANVEVNSTAGTEFVFRFGEQVKK